MPEIDPPFAQVVGGHFHRDFVARQDADPVLLHAPRGIGDHLVTILELDPATSVRKDFRYHAFELEHFFFGHAISLAGLQFRLSLGAKRNGADQVRPDWLRAPNLRS